MLLLFSEKKKLFLNVNKTAIRGATSGKSWGGWRPPCPPRNGALAKATLSHCGQNQRGGLKNATKINLSFVAFFEPPRWFWPQWDKVAAHELSKKILWPE